MMSIAHHERLHQTMAIARGDRRRRSSPGRLSRTPVLDHQSPDPAPDPDRDLGHDHADHARRPARRGDRTKSGTSPVPAADQRVPRRRDVSIRSRSAGSPTAARAACLARAGKRAVTRETATSVVCPDDSALAAYPAADHRGDGDQRHRLRAPPTGGARSAAEALPSAQQERSRPAARRPRPRRAFNEYRDATRT